MSPLNINRRSFHWIPGPKKIRRIIKGGLENHFYKYYFPKKYADYLFELDFGYGIDWEHPRDLNEWINYLAFNTNTQEWSRLADKFAVRNYVAEKGLSDLLIPLYGVWNDANDVDFDLLPNCFVIKTNHSSGNSIIVQDKTTVDLEKLREYLKKELSSSFGIDTAEPHYLRIKPLILAEQLIPPPLNSDYKVMCFYGEPDSIITISNRNIETKTFDLNVYDLKWQKHNEWLVEKYRNDVELPKPQLLDEMLHYARQLSEGFPHVRIDFYSAFDRVSFGEMTFTTCCGRIDFFTKEHLMLMGQKIKAGFHDNSHRVC